MTKREKVAIMACLLMQQHGLGHWSFKIGRGKVVAGWCSSYRQQISLSGYYIDNNEMVDILDTILHEIAHGLVGCGHGHDEVWKAKAREIGAKPERCYGKHIKLTEPSYVLKCDNCGKTWDYYRKPKYTNYLHSACNGGIVRPLPKGRAE